MKKDKTTEPQKPSLDVKAYADKANDSARDFVARLGEAILTLPRIKEKTQDAADAKAFKMLDECFNAFVKAQSDAIKFAVAQICSDMGIEKSFYPLDN